MIFNSYIYEYGKNIIYFHIILIICSVYLKFKFLCALAFFSLLFCIYFFRKIEKNIKYYERGIYAPAYGRIIIADKTTINNIEYHHIGIFISLIDPHIQYAPVSGILEKKVYNIGDFYPAFFQKSKHNEKMNYMVTTHRGKIIFNQIAGTIARTIVSFPEEGKKLKTGEEIGLIKFGSRSDIYIPVSYDLKILVKKGEYVKGGETLLAYYSFL